MEDIKINTVKKLSDELRKFDKKLPVAIFDVNRGYMSVAFKKEEIEENGKVFQWLTFYAHETIQMYDIETLQTYLSKLPPQANVLKKTEDGIYTSLYLSIDGMKDKFKNYTWLVISDEKEYDRFFKPNSVKENVEKSNNSLLEKALEKMLKEVTEESSKPIERIHQYLCKQTDEELFKGILTDGKTIKGAFAYCSDKAREQAENEPYAMVEDEEVFQWVKDYFIHYELPLNLDPPQKLAPKSKASKPTEKPKNEEQKSFKKGDSEQLDLFAMV